MQKKHGRHTEAFILLLLLESESYGAQLYTRMQEDLPHCFTDSADVYRCLNDLEKRGCIISRWETQVSGQPRKWYEISPKGRMVLEEQAEDIRKRHENFLYFGEHYNKLI